MAVVILGGLVTSTLLNLFVVPALYLRFGAGSVRVRCAATCCHRGLRKDTLIMEALPASLASPPLRPLPSVCELGGCR